MSEKVYRVRFLCTGNSARSIIAEALCNHLGQGRFVAYSAGSHPAGQVNQYAIDFIEKSKISTTGPRSKSWGTIVAGRWQLDPVSSVSSGYVAVPFIMPVSLFALDTDALLIKN